MTDWQIREGTYVTSLPMAAAGTFVDTSETSIVASFPASRLMHVKPGQDVELVFKSRPGRLYLGKVDTVIQASGEGQFETSGKLPSAASIGSPGFLAVLISLNDLSWNTHSWCLSQRKSINVSLFHSTLTKIERVLVWGVQFVSRMLR